MFEGLIFGFIGGLLARRPKERAPRKAVHDPYLPVLMLAVTLAMLALYFYIEYGMARVQNYFHIGL